MRIGWESVGTILERVVADYLDEGRLDGLVLIGVDEASYGADDKFVTCVADHHRSRIGIKGATPCSRTPQRTQSRRARRGQNLDQQSRSPYLTDKSPPNGEGSPLTSIAGSYGQGLRPGADGTHRACFYGRGHVPSVRFLQCDLAYPP
jgi:hypothetical protein